MFPDFGNDLKAKRPNSVQNFHSKLALRLLWTVCFFYQACVVFFLLFSFSLPVLYYAFDMNNCFLPIDPPFIFGPSRAWIPYDSDYALRETCCPEKKTPSL